MDIFANVVEMSIFDFIVVFAIFAFMFAVLSLMRWRHAYRMARYKNIENIMDMIDASGGAFAAYAENICYNRYKAVDCGGVHLLENKYIFEDATDAHMFLRGVSGYMEPVNIDISDFYKTVRR